MLREFIAQPFFNVREHDYQAVLFGKLRSRFAGSVPVRFMMNPAGSAEHSWKSPRTARVHRESCIGKKGVAGEYVNVDLVVLRDAVVTLPCHTHGPTAMQETVQLHDVEAAIEIKNAPSKNIGEARKFAADITRLARLQQRAKHVRCYTVVIDQSVSLPSASSQKDRVCDWLALVHQLSRHDIVPAGPFVEVWFVNPTSLVPERTFFSSDIDRAPIG